MGVAVVAPAAVGVAVVAPAAVGVTVVITPVVVLTSASTVGVSMAAPDGPHLIVLRCLRHAWDLVALQHRAAPTTHAALQASWTADGLSQKRKILTIVQRVLDAANSRVCVCVCVVCVCAISLRRSI
jgi:hypothetical protein